MKGPGNEREDRFIADKMLGKLCRWMRTLGFDVAYGRDLDDEAIIKKASEEGRVILTRDTRLMERKAARGRAVFVESDHIGEQLRFIARRFEIDRARILTRCLRCNALLEPIEPSKVKDRVAPYVYGTQKQFSACPVCRRVYWAGTHRPRMLEDLEMLIGKDDVKEKPEMKNGHILVLSTAPNQDEAARIAKAVVDEGLSACCNIVPGLRSIYRWKGKVCDEAEVLCLFKTRAVLFDRLKARIKELHSYDVPEIIAVTVEAGLGEYLGWIDEVTAKGE